MKNCARTTFYETFDYKLKNSIVYVYQVSREEILFNLKNVIFVIISETYSKFGTFKVVNSATPRLRDFTLTLLENGYNISNIDNFNPIMKLPYTTNDKIIVLKISSYFKQL